jgi:two-component system, response regulator YesN
VAAFPPRKPSFRVLVVEDEPRILRNIAGKVPLADPGFTVAATAENGRDALRLARELEPDLVLTDVVMPMMDGLELIRRLRADSPALPVAIISGYAEFEYARTAIGLGVEHYLLKPVKVEALREVLAKARAHLEGARRERELGALRDAVSRGAGPSLQTGLPASCLFMLLCVGCVLDPADTVPGDLRAAADACWRALEADPCLTGRERINRHWLVELGLPNQRLLALDCGQVSREWARDCAERVLRAARTAASPWSPTVVLHPEPRPSCGSYETAQMLKLALSAGLVAGRPRVIAASEAETALRPQSPLEPAEEARLRTLRHKGDRGQFLAAAAERLDDWVRRELPQRAMERGFDQLGSLLEADEPATGARRQLRDALLSTPEPSRIPSALAAALASALPRHGFRLDAAGVAEELEARILRDFAQPLGLKELGDGLGFDLSQVTRAFKRRTGETPMHYLTRVRLRRAMELLADGGAEDVGVIGAMVGYPDAHYFARIFRKVTGMTPTEYRARAGGAHPAG